MNDFSELLALCPSGLSSAKYMNLRNYVKRIGDYLELVIDLHESEHNHNTLSPDVREKCSDSFEAHKLIRLGKLILAEKYIKEAAQHIRDADRLSKD